MFSPYVLTPFEWLKMVLATESVTYVMIGYFGSLATVHVPAMRDAMAPYPISADDFLKLRTQCGNLQDAFTQAITRALDKRWSRFDKPLETFADYYCRDSLARYVDILNYRRDTGVETIFVRMDSSEVRKYGQIAGLDLMGNHPWLENGPPIPPAVLLQAERAHKEFDIGDHNSVRYFTQALAADGYTPDLFLGHSKSVPDKNAQQIYPTSLRKRRALTAA
jgi:hypothetical protein